MNKVLSNAVLVFSLIIILVFFITAQENLTYENESLFIYTDINQLQDAIYSLNLDNNTSPETNYSHYEENKTYVEKIIINDSELSLDKEKTEDILINDSSSLSLGTETNVSNRSLNNFSISSEKDNSVNLYNSNNEIESEYIPLMDEPVKYETSLNNSSWGNSEDITNNLTDITNNLTYTSLHVGGKKEIDIGEYNGMKITKEELEKSEFEKEVILSSEEDFEGYLRVYTSLTQESEINEISIYWKNQENLEITNLQEFSIEYYDENENGIIDRISWIVPHLSEQIFRVVVGLNYSNESEESILLNVSGPSGNIKNPILFNISVNYSENFSCNIQVGGIWEENFNSSKEYSLNLPNGNYNWGVVCINPLNSSVPANTTLGTFNVNETFYSSLKEGKTYFLDLIENKIRNNEIIIINSSSPSNFSVQIIKNGIGIISNKNYSNLASIPMNETLLNSAGNYSLKVIFNEPSPEYVISTNFSVASANIVLNTTSIKEGESVKITVIGESPLKKIILFSVGYGDGTQYNPPYTEVNQFNQILTKKYLNKGQYNINLTVIVDSMPITITKNGLIVTEALSTKDNDEPEITLLNPDPKEVIYKDAVNFSYKASDNIKIQNCTFKLYENCPSMTSCSTSESNLVFPTNSQQRSIANNYSVQNNKEVLIKLQDFEEGIYRWDVECYDNSSNYNWDSDFFQISLNETENSTNTEYEYDEEVNELKELADNFISLDFNLEEKEVLDGLNILNNTKYYKKRLLDIQEFFQENYKYVANEALRERKTNEYLDELETIKNGIPLSISIKEDYEYIKNSVDSDFEGIIEEYFYSTNTQLSKSSLRKLEEINKQIQNEISVSVEAKQVEIEYQNGTQKIIFVKKKVSMESDSYERILEIIPKEIVEDKENIIFITENEPIGENNIFEIDYGNLKNGEIIYYITEPVKLKELERTETILFEEDLTKIETSVTGFFVFSGFSADLTIYIALAFILLIIFLALVPMVVKKFRMIAWKKEPNVVKVIHLIEETNRLLKEREIEKARENYYKVKEIYPVLPYKTRSYFYKKISEMLVKIDKKDIFGLVKEYQEAKKRWDKENIMRLYEDIKKIYKRLPEKDRKKVYDIINGY